MATETVPKKSNWKRRLLPHHDLPGTVQHVIFRLGNSLPSSVLAKLNEEYAHLSERDRRNELMHRIEDFLDLGEQPDAYLADSRIAEIVQTALLHFDGERYDLQAWVVMPNHVHAVFMPFDCEELNRIVHSSRSLRIKPTHSLDEAVNFGTETTSTE